MRRLIGVGRWTGYLLMFVVGTAAVLIYPWIIELLVQRGDYEESWIDFSVIAAGIIAAAGYIQFSGFLQQAGHPGAQSTLIASVVILNIVGNLTLIPAYGVVGAAIATATAQVANVFGL